MTLEAWFSTFKILSFIGAFIVFVSSIGMWHFSGKIDKTKDRKIDELVQGKNDLIQKVERYQLDLSDKDATIKKLQSKVSDMEPGLRLLKSQQSRRDDGKWVTTLFFGSSYPVSLSSFTITLIFDEKFEESKPYVTGVGMAIAGKLDILEGDRSSRIFRFRGTSLMANNRLVVEFISVHKLQLVAIDLSPKPEELH